MANGKFIERDIKKHEKMTDKFILNFS